MDHYDESLERNMNSKESDARGGVLLREMRDSVNDGFSPVVPSRVNSTPERCTSISVGTGQKILCDHMKVVRISIETLAPIDQQFTKLDHAALLLQALEML